MPDEEATPKSSFGHDKLIISPPYVTSESQLDLIVERLSLALRNAPLDTLAHPAGP